MIPVGCSVTSRMLHRSGFDIASLHPRATAISAPRATHGRKGERITSMPPAACGSFSAPAPPANGPNVHRGSAGGELHPAILRLLETEYLGCRRPRCHEADPALASPIHSGVQQGIPAPLRREKHSLQRRRLVGLSP